MSRMGRVAAGERPWPGCTASVLLVHRGHLYVANAGDCRAVLCRDVSRAFTAIIFTEHSCGGCRLMFMPVMVC